jgi:NAD(P)-dependent dehydrogenase (short-subunit alcohol dehydrogenase family)
MTTLDGKVAIVTGASRGQARAIDGLYRSAASGTALSL